MSQLENKTVETPRPEWGKDFDTLFAGPYGYCNSTIAAKIKLFISSLISSTEKRVRAECAEEIRMMKLEGDSIFEKGSEFCSPQDYRTAGYNNACEDIARSIEGNK